MKWLYIALVLGALLLTVWVESGLNAKAIKSPGTELPQRQNENCPSPPEHPIPDRMLFVSACEEIMAPPKAGDCAGLVRYRDYLSKINTGAYKDNAESVADGMRKTIQDTFLFAKNLESFDMPEQFERYAHVNYNFAIYFGELDMHQGSFVTAQAMELFPYQKFCEYERQFLSKGRSDLAQIASDYRSRITEHIESQDGFVRQSIHHIVWLNTEFVKVTRPGRELSRSSAVKLARAYAKGLIRSGYTPKWLDEEFPLPHTSTPHTR